MKYIFDKTSNRKNTHSCKWDAFDGDLPMWVADMDFMVLPEIQKAIEERNNIGAFGYTLVPDEYYQSYKLWWKKHHDVDLDTKDMIFCIGVIAGLDSILKHLVPSGSGVIIQTPVYHVFGHCILNNNLKVVENPLIYENHEYRIDFDNLEKLLKEENNKVFLLCNPHNPVGIIWSKDDLSRIAELCLKYDVLLISDEIHCDITKPGCSYNSIFSVTNNAIALLSPSKAFNIAGVQAACIVCPNKYKYEVISKGVGMDDVGEPNFFSPFAAIAAYTYGDEWIKEMNEYIFENKKYIDEFIKRELPKAHLIDNDATYLLWLDLSSYVKDITAFTEKLRKETGLILSPGKQFGENGEGFVRINIATKKANVIDACSRLLNFLKQLTKGKVACIVGPK